MKTWRKKKWERNWDSSILSYSLLWVGGLFVSRVNFLFLFLPSKETQSNDEQIKNEFGIKTKTFVKRQISVKVLKALKGK